jgi:parallel beta-helix repeat protein
MNCVDGTLQDTCTAGTPVGADDECDGVDQNCNGTADENYVATATNCGLGVCAATGQLNCVGGTLQDTCTPGSPTGADDECDGVDQDCNGIADNNYVPTPTTCGIGACASTGTLVCQAGTLVDTCEEGTSTPEICDDGFDNDCDGSVDCADSDCGGCVEEACGPYIRYVSQTNCSDTGCGTLEVPYCTINAAIQNAYNGDTIVVRDGTYTGTGNKNLDFGGKAITVMSENGPESTIIDCQGSGRGFYFHTGESADSIVDGFTIINGSVTGNGGAILCESASPTITNCIISGNSAYNGAGIAYDNVVSPALSNCVLTGNQATMYGGGVDFSACSSATVTNCTISKNTAAAGGGISSRASTLNIRNSILWADTATYGAAYGQELGVGFTGNCSTVSVSYCDVKGGTASVGVDSGCTLNWDSVTNINADPIFVQPLHWDTVQWNMGDYHLSCNSPCIDAGTDAGIITDMDGDGRPYDAPGIDHNGLQPEFDMGADEYVGFSELCLTLVPDSVSIMRGGTLGYTATVVNPTDLSITFDYWTNTTRPGGTIYPPSGVLLGPYEVTLDPAEAYSQHFGHSIALDAPLGWYVYNAFIGDYPVITNEYHFNYQIIPF